MPANKWSTRFFFVFIFHDDDHHQWFTCFCLSTLSVCIIDILHTLKMKIQYFGMHNFFVGWKLHRDSTWTTTNYLTWICFHWVNLCTSRGNSQKNKYMQWCMLDPLSIAAHRTMEGKVDAFKINSNEMDNFTRNYCSCFVSSAMEITSVDCRRGAEN